jgi:hypothetical protein
MLDLKLRCDSASTLRVGVRNRDKIRLRDEPAEIFGMAPPHIANPNHADAESPHFSNPLFC